MTEKRQDAAIFIIGHKPLEYGYWDNALYTPIQVGYGEQYTPVRDNTGVNIADWNKVCAETTAFYWISRNFVMGKYVGVCQYRRRLEFPEDYDFDKAFEECDVIAAKPLRFGVSVANQYCHCHCAADLLNMEQVVKDLYPDYAQAWEDYIVNSNVVYYSNSFVMRAEDYQKYCDWLFSIFREYRKRMGWDSQEQVREYVAGNIEKGVCRGTRGVDYQMQLFAFATERLWTMYVQRNFKRIRHDNYVKFEGV